MKKMKRTLLTCLLATLALAMADAQRPRRPRLAFDTDTLMVHDPVLAYEDGTYYLFSTGWGLQHATSRDRKTWTVQPFGLINEPAWTHDSIPAPEFKSHLWAPDILWWRGQWWLTYSCSTFGKNTSAIGLMTSPTLDSTRADYGWTDRGCVVASQRGRDDWNAIDPNLIVDHRDSLWVVWGSFWDGIQLAPMSDTRAARTVARRALPGDTLAPENPTSKFAGRNAVEAPFLFRHDGWYYLFVSFDYCCRGAKSNYRVVVGRSRDIEGPYADRDGRPMLEGGGTPVVEGDHVTYEAVGHCAVYHLRPDGSILPNGTDGAAPTTSDQPTDGAGEDLFICHGYDLRHRGQSTLVQRRIRWEDGWPTLVEDE